MASRMGIGQEKINKAIQLSNNYGKDINGLKKVINENGGVSFLNKALAYYDKPLVKNVLSKAGVTPELVEGIKKDLGVVNQVQTSVNTATDLLTKLKHLNKKYKS